MTQQRTNLNALPEEPPVGAGVVNEALASVNWINYITNVKKIVAFVSNYNKSYTHVEYREFAETVSRLIWDIISDYSIESFALLRVEDDAIDKNTIKRIQTLHLQLKADLKENKKSDDALFEELLRLLKEQEERAEQ